MYIVNDAAKFTIVGLERLFLEFDMSAIDSMFNYLSNGHQVTARQARTLFKIENEPDEQSPDDRLKGKIGRAHV